MPKASDLLYGENKQRRVLYLTPTAWGRLKHQATALDLSPSELVERFARGLLAPDLNLELTGKRYAS